MSEDFLAWGKTPRLFKNMVITEKIDGTNGAVIVKRQPEDLSADRKVFQAFPEYDDDGNYTGFMYLVGAQSKNRLIAPFKGEDNAGFASWVRENAYELAAVLGEGHHFGEWWGNGIQRGYGLEKGDKRFSLFNTKRWGHMQDPFYQPDVPGLGVVPVLQVWEFDTEVIQDVFWDLMDSGSQAVPGYMKPEGIVIYHTAADQVFKMTDQGDIHKALAATVSSVPSAA